MRRTSAAVTKRQRRQRAVLGAIMYGAILAMGAVVMLGSTQHKAPAPAPAAPVLDVTRDLVPCPGEYGPGSRDAEPWCYWDGATMGTNPGGYTGPRWLVYVDVCPIRTVQNAALVECVPWERWGE